MSLVWAIILPTAVVRQHHFERLSYSEEWIKSRSDRAANISQPTAKGTADLAARAARPPCACPDRGELIWTRFCRGHIHRANLTFPSAATMVQASWHAPVLLHSTSRRSARAFVYALSNANALIAIRQATRVM